MGQYRSSVWRPSICTRAGTWRSSPVRIPDVKKPVPDPPAAPQQPQDPPGPQSRRTAPALLNAPTSPALRRRSVSWCAITGASLRLAQAGKPLYPPSSPDNRTSCTGFGGPSSVQELAVPRLAREAAALARLCLAATSVLAAWPLAFVQARKRRAAPLFVCAAAPGKTAARIPANSLRNRANSPISVQERGVRGQTLRHIPHFPICTRAGLVWAPSRASIPPSSIPVCRHGAGTCPNFEKAPSTYSGPLHLYKSGGLSTSTSSAGGQGLSIIPSPLRPSQDGRVRVAPFVFCTRAGLDQRGTLRGIFASTTYLSHAIRKPLLSVLHHPELPRLYRAGGRAAQGGDSQAPSIRTPSS